MRKIRIFIILFAFVSLLLSSFVFFNAYIKTGHDNFQEITFDDENVVLLVNRSKDEIDSAYKKIGKKIFGWSTYYFNINSKAEYVGDTLMSRSNRTGEVLHFSYKLREEDFKTTSLKLSAGIDVKVTAQNSKKTLSGVINPSFGVNKTNSTSNTKEEITEFKIDLAPYTRVSLRISGDCYVTSGVSKYYLFGIQMKKGDWERIDVETMYYELYEEILER